MKVLMVVLVGLIGCDYLDGTADLRRWKQESDERREGPCADVSWLLATTAGSPNEASCPNKRHKMRVQVATTSSHEEVGALVFCECQKEDVASAMSAKP
jgi:hypothetical protein